MLRLILSLLALISSLPLFAQNLVPNGSFEDTTACPWTDGQIQYAVGWFKPSVGSSDLIHSCSFGVPQNFFGHQNARTGNAYAGFYTYSSQWPDSSYREYISIKLTDSLEAGKTYDFEFYVSCADSMHYATILGAYLSSDSLFYNSVNNIACIPQLEVTSAITNKTTWTSLSYQYTAEGGEKYLTIGNFRDNSMSDTINTYDGGATWNPNYLAAYYFIDDISLTEDTTIGIQKDSLNEDFNIYPNPATDYFQINQTISKPYNLTIYNSRGQLLYRENSITTNDITVNTTAFPAGLLFIVIKSDNEIINYKLLKK